MIYDIHIYHISIYNTKKERMGVRGCLFFLKNSVIINTNVRQERKYIVIDTMSIIHQYKTGLLNAGNYIVDIYGNNVVEIYIIFKLVIRFLRDNIIPIFVFGNNVNVSNAHKKRRRIREKAQETINELFSKTEKKLPIFETKQEFKKYLKYIKRTTTININNINLIKFMLSLMSITVIEAPSDAVTQCAAIALTHNNVIGVLTNNFDTLLHGSPNIIRMTSINSNTLYVHGLDKILENINKICKKIISSDTKYDNVNFRHSHLIELCCLMGTDSCNGLRYDREKKEGRNIENLLKVYLDHDMQIERVLTHFYKIGYVSPDYITKMLNSVRKFSCTDIKSQHKIIHTLQQPKINRLHNLCKNFIEQKTLNSSLNLLSNIYADNVSTEKKERHYSNTKYVLPIPKKKIPIAICKS